MYVHLMRYDDVFFVFYFILFNSLTFVYLLPMCVWLLAYHSMKIRSDVKFIYANGNAVPTSEYTIFWKNKKKKTKYCEYGRMAYRTVFSYLLCAIIRNFQMNFLFLFVHFSVWLHQCLTERGKTKHKKKRGPCLECKLHT